MGRRGVSWPAPRSINQAITESGPTDAGIYVSRRKVNDLFLRGALESFAKDGPAAFSRAAKENPASYLKVFALLMPRELNVKTENVAGALSDEQLALMVAELEERIARRLSGGDAQVVEAKALPAPEPEPPAPKGWRAQKRSYGTAWTAERKAALSAKMKAQWAERKAKVE